MENKISMERFLISCISEVESMLQDADFEVSRKKYNDDTLGILVNKGYAGEIPIYYSSLMKCVIAKYRSRPYNDLPEFDDYEKMILLKEFSDKKFIRDLISYIAQKRIEGDFKEQNKREVVGSAAVEEDTISTTQVVNVPDAEVGTNIESNVCNPVFGEEKQEGSKENKYLSSDEAPNTNENKVKGRKPKKETKQQKRERLQKARLQLLKEKKAEKKASVVKKETSSSSIACVRSADADRRVQEREEVLKKVKARNEKVKGEMRVTDEDIDDISSEEKISGSLLPEEISADFLPKEALDDEKLGTLSDNDDFNKEKLTTVNVTGSRSNNIPRRKKSEAQGLEEGRNESAAQFSIGTLSGKSNVSRCANNKVQLRYGGLQAKGIVLFMAKYIDEVLSGKIEGFLKSDVENKEFILAETENIYAYVKLANRAVSAPLISDEERSRLIGLVCKVGNYYNIAKYQEAMILLPGYQDRRKVVFDFVEKLVSRLKVWGIDVVVKESCSTNSVYLALDNLILRSWRISDHESDCNVLNVVVLMQPKYRVISEIDSNGRDITVYYVSEEYVSKALDLIVKAILSERDAKIRCFGESAYSEKVLSNAREVYAS